MKLGDSGGFFASPNRGTNQYWDPNTYLRANGQVAYYGLDDLPLDDGSWIGFSVSAAGYPIHRHLMTPPINAFNNDEQAPPSPDGTYVAYVCNTNDFAVQIVSTNNLDPASPVQQSGGGAGPANVEFYRSL